MMKSALKICGILILGVAFMSAGNRDAGPQSGQIEQVLRIALEQDIETIDPQQNTARYTTTVCEGINEALLREHNGQMLPGMAASYETGDFITWTFHIRPDAKWSDGSPITARDFVYSYQEIFHRPECAKVYILFAGVKGYREIAAAMDEGKRGAELRAVTNTLAVRAVNDRTLVIELDSPRPYFQEMFASTAWSPIKRDLYEANGKAYGSAPNNIGMNGPFVVSRWRYNEDVVLEPNPNYWNKAAITLQRVEIKIVKDNEPRANMFREGSLDFMAGSSENYRTMKDNLLVAPGSANYYLLLNYQRRNAAGRVVNQAVSSLMANRNFINAISTAIDRTVLYSQVLDSPAFRATGWAMPEYINLNDERRNTVEDLRSGASVHPTRANVNRAKEYLAAAMAELGYTGAAQIPEISIVFASSTDPRTIVEYVELSVEQNLGIKIALDPVEFNVRDTRIITGDYDMLYMGWGISSNDPLGYLDVWADDLFATGWPLVFPAEYRRYSAIIAEAVVNRDMNARARQLLEAERIVLNGGPLIPLAFSSEVGLIQSRVSGFSLRMFNAPYDYIFASITR
jgi:oligopeptide transport system substrate-binding protein